MRLILTRQSTHQLLLPVTDALPKGKRALHVVSLTTVSMATSFVMFAPEVVSLITMGVDSVAIVSMVMMTASMVMMMAVSMVMMSAPMVMMMAVSMVMMPASMVMMTASMVMTSATMVVMMSASMVMMSVSMVMMAASVMTGGYESYNVNLV